MPSSLRTRLIGVWKLVSWVETPVDGSAERLPLGPHPSGIIIYHPAGYVSAQLMRADRRPFASGDWSAGTAADYQAEATSYFAYCGPFHADDDSQTVIHSAEVSLFPNWTGQVLRRHVMIDKDILRLSTVGPYVSGGNRVHACMTWNRAETSYCNAGRRSPTTTSVIAADEDLWRAGGSIQGSDAYAAKCAQHPASGRYARRILIGTDGQASGCDLTMRRAFAT